MLATDVQVVSYVRKAALESNEPGREFGWIPELAPHLGHIVATDPGGCWAAEIGGLVVGYAQAIVRGDIWFLSQLFVQPEVHALGVGQELLRCAMDYGRERASRVFSVVSSISPAAQSLYMRNGMYPIGIGYRMSGPIEPFTTLPEPDGNRKKIVDCSGWQDRMAELDAQVFGAERREDHEMYLRRHVGSDATSASFGLTRDGEFAGYAYVEDGGRIAPIAAREPTDQLPLLRMCAEWLHERDVTDGRMWITSLNPTMMRAALDAGWRIGSWSFLLTSEPFGQFDRYHPSGGLLL